MVQPQVHVQPEQKRVRNFQEVSHGYPKRVALEEAARCPQCSDAACLGGCPAGVDIPGFIRMLREGNAAQAYELIKQENSLPSVCGRICPAPCETVCIEKSAIGIRALERYVADQRRAKPAKKTNKPSNGKKIAIVGSGPSGLAAAHLLAKEGFPVTMFEAMDKSGGVLRYGIPEFRLPKKVLDEEIDEIRSLGVKIKTNFFIGKTAGIDELRAQGYQAILLATGASKPKFMDLPGVSLGSVYYGEEFLMRINRIKSNLFSKKKTDFSIGRHVAVIGSGNTALDCARSARRLGKEVTLIFRRTEEEMRVRPDEREYAEQEGVKFESLTRPVEIIADEDDFVGGIKCIRMDFAEEDKNGEWELAPVPDSEFVIDVDTVIIAIGHKPNSILRMMEPKLKVDQDESIAVDAQTYFTSMEGVFACGNVVTNAGPVVEAIASGKQAAAKIIRYLEPDESKVTGT